jgi:hypothetical protein
MVKSDRSNKIRWNVKFKESYFFINKNSWNNMLAGKLIEMVAAGVISETLSKQIVSVFSSN